MFDTCPKCGYQAPGTGNAGICGGCGLVFAKWVERHKEMGSDSISRVDRGWRAAKIESDPNSLADAEDETSLASRLWQLLLYVPERTDPMLFWGRVALYAAFFVWGWYFILLDFRAGEIGNSFMHRVNLVFHEAGHVIFMPFGRFMHTLGGSLGQLLMPIVVMIALLWKNRDTFGASFGLWWLGQSLMDLAPYINDARDLQLMLLGGGTGQDRPGIHDWENIFIDLGMLEHDHQIAAGADALGTIIVLLALAWGAYVLYLQHDRLSRPA